MVERYTRTLEVRMPYGLEVQILSCAQYKKAQKGLFYIVRRKESYNMAFREDLKSGAGHPVSRLGRELGLQPKRATASFEL